MGLLSHLFFFNLLILEFNAYIEPPVTNSNGGKSNQFTLFPHIVFARHEKVKEIQEEITTSWPEGIITYYIDDINYDTFIEARIRTAMSVLEAEACIRFKVKKEKPKGNITWIHITNPSKKRECVHDPTLANKGEIVLILGYDCLGQKQLIHTLLHGIGFKDEVTHPHRNNYIKVIWDNIQPAYRHLYKIQHVENVKSIVEYDPLSIMHFHDRAFSSNGKVTIVPLESGLTISPSDSLSQLDKMRLQLYFGHECNKRKFSSLMETCIKSLKDEQEIPPDEDNSNKNYEKTDVENVDAEGTIEKDNSNKNYEKTDVENVDAEGTIEKDNSNKNYEKTDVENVDAEGTIEKDNSNKNYEKTDVENVDAEGTIGKDNSNNNYEKTDVENVDAVGTIEKEENNSNTDKHVKFENMTKNEKEMEDLDDNVENKKENKPGRESSNENIIPDGMKKNQKGYENSGEKNVIEDIKKNKKMIKIIEDSDDNVENIKENKEGRGSGNKNIVSDGKVENQKGDENSGEKMYTRNLKNYKKIKENSKKVNQSKSFQFRITTFLPKIVLKKEDKDSASVSDNKDDVAGVDLNDNYDKHQ